MRARGLSRDSSPLLLRSRTGKQNWTKRWSAYELPADTSRYDAIFTPASAVLPLPSAARAAKPSPPQDVEELDVLTPATSVRVRPCVQRLSVCPLCHGDAVMLVALLTWIALVHAMPIGFPRGRVSLDLDLHGMAVIHDSGWPRPINAPCRHSHVASLSQDYLASEEFFYEELWGTSVLPASLAVYSLAVKANGTEDYIQVRVSLLLIAHGDTSAAR